jgi:hypothetical protein
MPLTPKGRKILKALVKEYKSKKKAKSILYAGKNTGRFTRIDKPRRKRSIRKK